MPEDAELLDDDQKVTDETPDWDAQIKELKAQVATLNEQNQEVISENKKYRERARRAEIARLQEKFPSLSEEDVQGLNLEMLGKVLSKAVGQTPQEQPAGVPDEVREASKDFVKGSTGAQTPAVSALSDLSARDLDKKLRANEISEPEYVAELGRRYAAAT